MRVRRYTRLTSAFSRSVHYHWYSTALFLTHYSFCRPHGSLRTPAMAAELADRPLDIAFVIRQGRRRTRTGRTQAPGVVSEENQNSTLANAHGYRALTLARSTCRYEGAASEQTALRLGIKDLAESRVSYERLRIHMLLRMEGESRESLQALPHGGAVARTEAAKATRIGQSGKGRVKPARREIGVSKRLACHITCPENEI